MFVAYILTLCVLVGPLRFTHLAAPVPMRLPRRRPLFTGGQESIEIGIGLGDDLLTQFYAQLGSFDFSNRSVFDVSEVERSERDTDQPVHLQAQRFKNLAHLAVLALANGKGQPDIRALFAVERRFNRTVVYSVDGDAVFQTIECLLPDASQSPHAVPSQPTRCRQFQYARQAAVIGEQQQAFSVDVQSSNADDPWKFFWQRTKNGVSPLRIGMRRHQSARLVIEKKPCAFARPQGCAVDRDLVRRCHIESGRRNNLAVDRYASG